MPESPVRRDLARAARETERFEQALRGAYDDPWWRQLIVAVRDRRQEFLEQLAMGVGDQRMEDRVRGQISELTWILALDKYGETHPLAREEGNDRATG